MKLATAAREARKQVQAYILHPTPTLAVDLDLTLTRLPWTSHNYIPPVAKHARRVITRMVREAQWQVIIYTCRPDFHMVNEWASTYLPGLISGINYNPADALHVHAVSSKPFANIYIDDKSYPLDGTPINWYDVERWLEKRGILKGTRQWKKRTK